MAQFFIWLIILLLFTGATVVSGYKAKEAWDNWHRNESANATNARIRPVINEMNGDFVSGDKTVIGTQVNNNVVDLNQSSAGEASKIEIAKLKIKRAFENYEQAVETVRKNFSKESDRVAGEFNMGGSFKGGRHIKVQMDLSVTTKEKLKGLFTELKRKIEDVLIENFNKPALSSFGNNFNEEKQRLADAEIKLHEIYKLLTDSPKSWEVRIFGELSQTKDFNLNED